MKKSEFVLKEVLSVVSVQCDCCKTIFDVVDDNYFSFLSLGFAVLTGEDDAGFGTRSYEEHACSYDCTCKLLGRHMMPEIKVPYVYARSSRYVKERKKEG